MLKFLLTVFVALILSACEDGSMGDSPAYIYVAPHTPGGVICIDQCHEAFDFCHKVCAMEFHACVSDVQAAAQHEYESYAKEQFNAHKPAERKPSEFEHIAPCVDANERCVSRCDTPYNSCYSSCGGLINP